MAETKAPADPTGDFAVATPTKKFFVDMLVRDIDLKDAILDLLDNCVDGILRSGPINAKLRNPYAGYRADIVVGSRLFSITDNCGGIPIEIARNSAFAIGRPEPPEAHAATATVGMYGVGMKRALFKFGRRSTVTSYSDVPLRVQITPEWLDDKHWSHLPIAHPGADEIKKGTTKIVVEDLNKGVAFEFGEASFVTELETAISQHFALILNKGFAVTIRADAAGPIPEIVPAQLFELLGPNVPSPTSAIAPYVYRGTIGKVEVELYAGLYRPMLGEDELEEEEWARGSANDSGWTVACNDRIVIWKDRGRLTGWGEASVPNWHGQFLGIVGLVMLRAADPEDLPLTTTKRGVDAASDVWSYVKDMMRDAIKAFTNFTNKWKVASEERTALFSNLSRLDLSTLHAQEYPLRAWAKVDTVMRSAPLLPSPKVERKEARVSFTAPKGQVVALAYAYFDDQKVKPRYVGEEAFRREYKRLPQAAE